MTLFVYETHDMLPTLIFKGLTIDPKVIGLLDADFVKPLTFRIVKICITKWHAFV